MAEDNLREVEFDDEQEVPETKSAADVFLEWIHATIYHQKLMSQVIYMQEYKTTIQNRIVTNEEYLRQSGWEEG